jgi:predicted Fe-Mo cluster-binding NifX family protein
MNNNLFPSKYSNGKSVTAAQYIAEFICERIAKKQNKDLHFRFWLSPEWEKEYKGQITAAHKLLKKYSYKDIIDGLLSSRGIKIYSLRAPHLDDIIEQIKKQKKDLPVPQPKSIHRNLLDTGKKDIVNKNILDKLKEIENGTSR